MPAAENVTVGLASHWPCVADFSGLSTRGLTAVERKIFTPHTLITGYGTLYLCIILLPEYTFYPQATSQASCTLIRMHHSC